METFSKSQNTSISHTYFILLSFPGISISQTFLLIPFLPIYIVILTGNCLVMHRIWVEKTLQSPMYSLISLLLAVNVVCTTAIMPRYLLGLAFGYNRISLSGCMMQMFFVYLAIVFESSVGLLMALDRYMAICKPLRYHSIMTNRFLVQLSLVCMARSFLLVTPIVILVSRLNFCDSNMILSFACENMALLKLGCGNVSMINLLGLLERTIVSVIDVSLLLASYLSIFSKAMKIAKGNSIHKALNTCCTHILAAFIIYTCGLLSSIVYRMATSIPINIQNLVSALYYLFPAAVNPFIYGIRAKEIRVCLIKSYKIQKVNHEGVNK
ncbi:olfactory receptor 52K2-like [Pelodytes ibericus]